MADRQWEVIEVQGADKDSDSPIPSTERMRVPGGWIVRSTLSSGSVSGGVSVHQLFVPDTDHRWSWK